MTREIPDEDAAFAEIVDRLAERYPHLPTDRIDAAVQEARHHFEQARVRDFVPVLVEREARAWLERAT
jgi:hypothetical protein